MIPRSPASARGLRVIPCITVPARAKAAPVTQAAKALGKRISSIICESSGDVFGWNIALNNSRIFPPATPTLTDISIEISKTMAADAKKTV